MRLDGKVHLTVANLNTNSTAPAKRRPHEAVLRAIFSNEQAFAVHGALPQVAMFGDRRRGEP